MSDHDWSSPGVDNELEKDENENAVLIGIVIVAVIAIAIGVIYHNGVAGVSMICFVAAGLIFIINFFRGEGDIIVIPAILAVIAMLLGGPPPQ